MRQKCFGGMATTAIKTYVRGKGNYRIKAGDTNIPAAGIQNERLVKKVGLVEGVSSVENNKIIELSI